MNFSFKTKERSIRKQVLHSVFYAEKPSISSPAMINLLLDAYPGKLSARQMFAMCAVHDAIQEMGKLLILRTTDPRFARCEGEEESHISWEDFIRQQDMSDEMRQALMMMMHGRSLGHCA
jgi:hypothetical protein